ncbi:MAG: phosphoglycerate dehydrogenase [Melioribacteraceae bacterium]|nr:phosphoglycerate dehydrogenase [Melioribacteraceae bacterium]MCF8263493.1 phosphoglycerate dehydrogenase [Melioribacteraceae bacterium]MCF8296953.1 phosphoglycerate dehydrogenase [Saprospiraceae bacterium]
MKVLISPSSFGQCGMKPVELLEKHGYEIINNPFGRKLTEDEVIEIASDAVGIVAGVEPLTRKVMDRLNNLKCISRVGVGMDSVDLAYAEEKGIIVRNTPDGPTRAVAELTVGLTLDLLRGISFSHSQIKNGGWKKFIGNLILDKKIGVLGFGRIGRETSLLFKGLGAKVQAYDLYPDVQFANENDIKLVNSKTLFETSDIITIHLPPSDDGIPIISNNELNLMNSDSFLINVSRGGVVDEDALYDSLLGKKIAGAALDVFKNEPYKGKLTDLENIIFTPHLGSYASEGKLKMEIDAVENLLASI